MGKSGGGSAAGRGESGGRAGQCRGSGAWRLRLALPEGASPVIIIPEPIFVVLPSFVEIDRAACALLKNEVHGPVVPHFARHSV